MYKTEIGDRCYISDEKTNGIENVRHGFTTAKGGFSEGKINGLNLGFRVGDNPENVMKNYEAVARDLNMPLENMVLSRQTHTDNIRIVTKSDRGKGLIRESDIYDTDGLITNEKMTPLVVFSADCIPVLLSDKNGRAVGAVHAGWRGTAKKIAAKAVSLMEVTYGISPRDIIAAIGPGIGKCCFEAGKEVAGEFDRRFVTDIGNGKYTVDLHGANAALLQEAGVLEDNISVAGMCTKCNCDMFYSYRAHGDKTGRMGALIMLVR